MWSKWTYNKNAIVILVTLNANENFHIYIGNVTFPYIRKYNIDNSESQGPSYSDGRRVSWNNISEGQFQVMYQSP